MIFYCVTTPHSKLTYNGTFTTDIVLLATVLPAFIPADFIGTINGVRATQIFADYTVAFFGTHLLGESSVLLSGDSADYPEVQFVNQ
jgi:hypothetical protein